MRCVRLRKTERSVCVVCEREKECGVREKERDRVYMCELCEIRERERKRERKVCVVCEGETKRKGVV